MKKNITRKEAIKKMGQAALAGAVLPKIPIFNSEDKTYLPNIISRKPGSKPNFLFIMAEGTPLNALGCYGSYRMQTPNIDKLASEGMKLENSFCSNALCSPSRATMLTGTYSHINGMPGNPGNTTSGVTSNLFDGAQLTFPKILKENGYSTGFVGKWHLGSTPTGFDYWKIRFGGAGPYYNPEFYEKPENGSGEEKNVDYRKYGVKKQYKGYATDITTDLAIEGMKKFKAPFCMIFSPVNDHSNFEPPDKYKHIYDNRRILEPGTFWDDYSNRSAAAKEAHMRIEYMADFQLYGDIPKQRLQNLTDKQKKQWNYQQFIKSFMGAMRSLDDNVGRLMNFLDESGLRDNTIVIYTADHGFFLGEHGWFDKRFMYEESIRVPWLIRYPGEIKAGGINEALMLNIDNAPTLLDLAGIAVPKEMQGVSLKPILEGKNPADWRKSMYYHYYEWGPPHWIVPCYGIRTERYSLINYYTINEWELFDRKYDPDEMNSLFKMGGYEIDPNYEDVVLKLVEELKQLREKYKDTTGVPVKLWPTDSYN